MDAPAHLTGVIRLPRGRCWLDLAPFAAHLDHAPVTAALRYLHIGGEPLDDDGLRRVWTWLSGLLDSPWGLTGHLTRLSGRTETDLLTVLAVTAELCHRTATRAIVSDTEWREARAAAENVSVTSPEGQVRWTMFHALTAAHTIADAACEQHLPADRVAVVEAFTALSGTVSDDDQRHHILRAALAEWDALTADGGER